MGKRVDHIIQNVLRNQLTGAVLIVLFLLSLVPMFALAGVNCASGDDFGYGALTRQAWLTTHSIPALFGAAADTVDKFYHGWQGTWFSIFIFSLQPEVFSPNAYIIVPFLMLFLWICSTGLLLRYVLVRLCGFSLQSYLGILLCLLTAGIQFIPSTKSAIFWYNGTAHYTVPYAMVLAAIAACLLYMREKKKSAFWLLLLLMTLLGGANYQAALLGLLVIGGIAVLAFWKGQKPENRMSGDRKRALLLLLPLGAECIGLMISITAPGNKARGGDSFGFHGGQALATILQCFVQAAKQALSYLTEHPLLLLLLFCIWLFSYYAFRQGNTTAYFPYPVLAVVAAFCIYSAMYAPQIYAGVEVSGGVHNMNYLVFLIMAVWDIVYLTGWCRRRFAEKEYSGRMGILLLLAMLAGVFLLVLCRRDIKDTTTYLSMEYQSSGQAGHYREQMALYRSVLLDETVTDVTLPQVNDVQGPLMHMPLTEDENAWTNTVMRDFYRKERIVAVPKDQWEAMQKETK